MAFLPNRTLQKPSLAVMCGPEFRSHPPGWALLYTPERLPELTKCFWRILDQAGDRQADSRRALVRRGLAGIREGHFAGGHKAPAAAPLLYDLRSHGHEGAAMVCRLRRERR